MKWINQMVLIALAVVAVGVGCQKQDAQESKHTGKPVVYTTFYPTQYFAERIGGDLIDVVCPVPEEEDAIFWTPDAKDIAAYQKADLIVINGAQFAKWVQKVSLPESRVVNTANPFTDRFINFEHATVHSHGNKGEHAHEGLDGHTWVDPVNAEIQAYEIKKALVKRYPEHKAAFEKGFSELAHDLDMLDRQLKAYQAAYQNQPILASHPAYNYIAKRYGWNIVNLDLDPEEMPSDEGIQEIKATLEKHPAKYLIWEAYPTPAIADRMKKELGLISVEFSPCELLSEDDISNGVNYLTVMQNNLKNVAAIFEGPSEK
jgi:zinc transport system substrate-binding protein